MSSASDFVDLPHQFGAAVLDGAGAQASWVAISLLILPSRIRWSTWRSPGVSWASRSSARCGGHGGDDFARPNRLPGGCSPRALVPGPAFQEVDRAHLHRLHGHRHVAVAGNKDDWQSDLVLNQLPMQFQAAHPRHRHVETRQPGCCGRRPGIRPPKRTFNVWKDDSDRRRQRSQRRRIVVDQENRGLFAQKTPPREQIAIWSLPHL